MWSVKVIAIVAALFPTCGLASLDPCPHVEAIRYPFQLDKDWSIRKLADGLSSPRGIVMDEQGRLLIVQQGVGISQHTIDTAGCIKSSRMLISMPALNHGISLSVGGGSLFASSANEVFRWEYHPESGDVEGQPITIVSGMASDGHVTRTLAIPPHHPDLLVVAHGSNGNLDYASADPKTARAIVKVFNLSTVPDGGLNYAKDGWNAGYGLRNEVGLAFDGNSMLWGVENSADNLVRTVNGTSTDVHNDNPAEELNFLGDVTVPNNQWYGYPTCFTIWQPETSIVNTVTGRELSVGQQFVQAPNETFNDDTCIQKSVPPRLSFQAHTAPLDAKFDAPDYKNLYVTLHGSWDRDPPVGFKLVAVPFARGSDGSYGPTEPAYSRPGYTDIFGPFDEGKCSATTCARPVGLAFDETSRLLYMTSDTSGEVFVLQNIP
ncbi:soluble quino protein glucose/sorbosone dehydrogenase [Hypomontagnella monticulosa]|nr:soluble quino protein glucose/sorbosone dehydrogenase [Hypomontagnella monticulosa]